MTHCDHKFFTHGLMVWIRYLIDFLRLFAKLFRQIARGQKELILTNFLRHKKTSKITCRFSFDEFLKRLFWLITCSFLFDDFFATFFTNYLSLSIWRIFSDVFKHFSFFFQFDLIFSASEIVAFWLIMMLQFQAHIPRMMRLFIHSIHSLKSRTNIKRFSDRMYVRT